MRSPRIDPESPPDPRPYKLCENKPSGEVRIVSEFATAAEASACLRDINDRVKEEYGDSIAFEWEIHLVLRSQSAGTIDVEIDGDVESGGS